MRVLTVVGARPQFIKLAPVSRAMADRPGVESVVIHTGQHFDDEMSKVFFDELGIPEPDANLAINAGTHGEMTGRMVEALESIFTTEQPDWVLVYGDTNSTLAAAIAASKMPTRLAHVEAGLRSFNRAMPEEINRVLTDHVSHLCLTPTAIADENLAAEGIHGDVVRRTGDVMFDAVRIFGEVARSKSSVLERAGVQAGVFVLATVHRAENTDDPRRLAAIVDGLRAVADETPVVLPVHPRTAKAIERNSIEVDGISVLPPVGYLDMLALEGQASCVVTDSGGVQKEAFFQGRPCITLRTETEWVELVDLGWNRLLPPTSADFVSSLAEAVHAGAGSAAEPYGDGHAAERVVDALSEA